MNGMNTTDKKYPMCPKCFHFMSKHKYDYDMFFSKCECGCIVEDMLLLGEIHYKMEEPFRT